MRSILLAIVLCLPLTLATATPVDTSVIFVGTTAKAWTKKDIVVPAKKVFTFFVFKDNSGKLDDGEQSYVDVTVGGNTLKLAEAMYNAYSSVHYSDGGASISVPVEGLRIAGPATLSFYVYDLAKCLVVYEISP